MNLKDYVANVPNFPKEGIQFKDITPLMADGEAYNFATSQWWNLQKAQNAELIVGPEARGIYFWMSSCK